MAHRNHRNAASRPSIYQTVTDCILSSLKAGAIPFPRITWISASLGLDWAMCLLARSAIKRPKGN